MNISSREKKLLIIVISVALGVLYYQIPFKNNSQELEKVRSQFAIKDNEKKEADEKIRATEKNREKLANLMVTAEELGKDYYPEIIQEKLIKEVKELMEKNNLKGDYSWSERNADELENLTPAILNLPKSSVQALANIIKANELDTSLLENANKEDKKDEENNTENGSEVASNETSTATPETATPAPESTPTNSNGEKSGPTPVKMVLTIKFKGNYDSLRGFVQDIKDYGRVVGASALSTEWSSANDLEGQIDVEFYSVPKINDEDNDYLDWK